MLRNTRIINKMTQNGIWKFGYGSNLSPEFARTKKSLEVLDFRRCILKGFALSFPKGGGIDYIEPSFATIRKEENNPEAVVHGTCLLLSQESAERLDNQERAYNVEKHVCEIYAGDDKVDGKMTLTAEVYCPRRLEAEGFPQGPCSERYRDILRDAAKSVKLDDSWIKKLQNLETYTPSDKTLKLRATLPIFKPKDGLPAMTIEELKTFNGQDPNKPDIHVSICGYIFENNPIFKVYAGRDYTFRMMLQRRGISLDKNDDGGVSPFPILAKVSREEPKVLEFALQARDRMMAKSGEPKFILKEFWEEQE